MRPGQKVKTSQMSLSLSLLYGIPRKSVLCQLSPCQTADKQNVPSNVYSLDKPDVHNILKTKELNKINLATCL